ncbi:hypothetical protein A4X03_0g8874 [Tilletia caries]|uniref:Ndc10 domain-containing protein n=3 Tax=Tilletia TaxID=13289 RepID=A0A8T8SEH0_9BASI|nr:hypothetical protein CF335_g8780 [Tilletia laevis]KAE8238283.1 hypothetical protein A4X03_0g8874 [Tilletia caries]
MPHSRPQEARAFVVTLRSSKGNTVGRNEWGVATRHRDVESCPVGALGLYLFERWHQHQHPTPTFDSRASWYDEKLLVSADSTAIEWYDQSYLLRHAFDEVGVASSKLTHAMRSGGARFAHEAGCTEDSLRIHGRWCGDRMIERYLGGVSIQPIRALADFDIKGGDNWLPRALLEPDASLQQQIFPFVESEEAKVRQRHKDRGEEDYAAVNFLQLLKWLRVVLLQDAVLLQPMFPALPIWRHAPFSTAAFQAFAQTLRNTIASTPTPFDVTMSTLVPELGRALSGLQAMLSDIANKSATTAIVQHQGQLVRSAVSDAVVDLKEYIGGLFRGLASADHAQRTAQRALAFGMQQLATASAEVAESSAPSFLSSALQEHDLIIPSHRTRHLSPSPTTTEYPTPGPPSFAPNADLSGNPSAIPALPTPPAPPPPPPASILALAREVRSVAQLMVEWRDGGSGRRGLKLRLDEGDKTLEKGAPGAAKQLSRWRIVFELVEYLSETRAEAVVVEALQKKMDKERMGLRTLAEKRGKQKETWLGELFPVSPAT